MSEQLKQRSFFIAVPVDSDFGLPESKNKGWLTAHEKYEDAEEMKLLFESGGVPHQVIQFYQSNFILSIDHAKEGSNEKSVECIAESLPDGSTKIVSIRERETKESAGMKETTKTCLKCGARYIFPRWERCEICAKATPPSPAFTPWLDQSAQERPRTAQRTVNLIHDIQIEELAQRAQLKGAKAEMSKPQADDLDRKIAELKGLKIYMAEGDSKGITKIWIQNPPGGFSYEQNDPWSTSDTKAFELVDELTKDLNSRLNSFTFLLHCSTIKRGWVATFQPSIIGSKAINPPPHTRESLSRPQAICRAYIAAMEFMKGKQ